MPPPPPFNENCGIAILNRVAQVRPDGTWMIQNVPTNFGMVRARATCVVNGVTRSGQSEPFLVPQNGIVTIGEIRFDVLAPEPASLAVSAESSTLTTPGATSQLAVDAVFPDGSRRDVTSDPGTSYITSNPRIAMVNPGGRVTAVSSGTALITVLHEAVSAVTRMNVILSNADSDSDGIPDDVELANGLDPNNPVDALEDFDNDGLTNIQELQLGTSVRAADTDGDGLSDGREVTLGTSPVLADTDGDGVRDGLEIQTGSDPLNPASFNLAGALESIEVAPARFVITFNTIAGDAFRQLVVTGTLRDGTTIDLTSTARGTNYTSNDLTICNFGAEPGRVFAGNSGTCAITVTNSGFSDIATAEIRTFAPTPLSFISIPGFVNNVDVNGDFAFVAAGSTGLQIVDVNDRAAPRIVASLDTPGNANDVRVVGNLAFVADGSAGLQIIDVANPLTPVRLGLVDTPGEAWDVAVSGDLVLIADGASGLQIISAADPSSPALLGSLDTPGTAKGVDVVENLAVVADGASGIRVIDLSNPGVPVGRGDVATPGDARDVVVHEANAYVAGFTGSLQIVDFSSPTAPRIVGITPQAFGGILMDVAFRDPFVLGADVFFVNGVPIINVEISSSPVARARLDFTGRDVNFTGIAVDGSFVYLTAEGGSSTTENGAVGSTNLLIGQYLALEDLAGIPPAVNITAPVAGATFVEGETIAIRVDATDDVTVTAVEFLIGGSTVFTDTSAPYAFNTKAPTGVSRVTLGARAFDPGGNAGVGTDVVINIIPDPRTTVVGTVVDADGNPVAGATVTALGLAGLTAADGTFSIPNVPTVAGSIRVVATLLRSDGTALTGTSAVVPPVRAGTTNVGTITLQAGIVVIQVFDAAADFSLATNPNGPWTYGATQTLGSITPFTAADQVNPSLVRWHLAPGITESSGAPVVAFNPSTSNVANGSVVVRPGQLIFHPGPDSFGVVRWTAPEAGQYEISAMFSGGDQGDTEVLVLRGSTPIYCGDLNGFGDMEIFRRAANLGAGEAIDFVVGNAGNFFFDTTFLTGSVTQISGFLEAAVFEDDFNCENGRAGALNYAGLANWNVSNGTVDLHGNGFFDFFPTFGLYADLDGSTSDAGLLESKQAFTLSPGPYELRFDLAGTQRSADTNSAAVRLGTVFNETFTLGSSEPFRTSVRSLRVDAPATATLSFDNAGGDNLGLFLDNVKLRRVGASPPQFLGPSPYRSQADSPFDLAFLGVDFFLEDFEDGMLDTPGVSASIGFAIPPPFEGFIDSVDADDGAIDGNGSAGHSFHSFFGSAGISFSFDRGVLGFLPTHAGIVWTDGAGSVTFEAFDADGVSLGVVGPLPLPDNSFSGTTAEDRFLGAIHAGGISAIRITNSSGAVEVDHLQYGRSEVAFACVPRPADLVGFWPADGTADDLGNSNPGTLQNSPTFAPGKVGPAFSFDGVNDFVKVPRSPTLDVSNQVTVEFWMNADLGNPMNACCQGLVATDFYLVEISGGRDPRVGVNFSVDTGTGPVHTSDLAGGGFVVSSGEWHHIAGTYDGASLKLYVDGVRRAQTPHSGTISPMFADSFMTFGSEDGRTVCPSCIGTRYFDGRIDEVAVYNRALADTEIQAIFDAGHAGKCR